MGVPQTRFVIQRYGVLFFLLLLFLQALLLALEGFKAGHHAAASLLALGGIVAVGLIIGLKLGQDCFLIGRTTEPDHGYDTYQT